MVEEGYSFSSYMQGIISLNVLVIVYHLVIIFWTNNFDWPWFCWFAFSFMWFWFIAERSDSIPNGVYYKSITYHLWKSPVYWLTVIMGVGITVVPLYAWTKYRQLYGGYPVYDLSYRKQFA